MRFMEQKLKQCKLKVVINLQGRFMFRFVDKLLMILIDLGFLNPCNYVTEFIHFSCFLPFFITDCDQIRLDCD